MRNRAVVSSPIGRIALEEEEGVVVAVHLAVDDALRAPSSPVLEQAEREIGEYFAGERRSFGVPVRRPEGASAFQGRVWDSLEHIPFGQTLTYGQVAEALETSPRAVGGACARNALPLLIPCHRVVARNGLGGFSGEWETGSAPEVKRALLALETKFSRTSTRR